MKEAIKNFQKSHQVIILVSELPLLYRGKTNPFKNTLVLIVQALNGHISVNSVPPAMIKVLDLL